MVEVGVDEGEESGVGHRAVGAESDRAVGKFAFAGFAVARKIDQAAFVIGVVAGPGLVIGFFEVLAAGDKSEGAFPIEFWLFAVFAIFGDLTGVIGRFEGEVGV